MTDLETESLWAESISRWDLHVQSQYWKQWRRLGVFLVNFKQILHAVLNKCQPGKGHLEEANEKISFMCKNNNFIFVDNINISNIHLFDGGLHLVESGRCILANNVIDRINNFLLTHRHHPNIHMHTMEWQMEFLERDIYRNNRQISDL